MHCEHFQSHHCRSCSLLDNTYEATLEQKTGVLRQLFPDALIQPFAQCRDVAGSRIRAKLAVTGTFEQPQLGFYDDQQKIVAVDDCPLHHPLINEFTQRLPAIIRETRLAPYDMQTDRGELKFIVLTCSPTHRQLMVQFVLRSREAVDRIRSFWRRMTDEGKQLVAVMSINLQPVRSSTISGSEEIIISDQATLPIRFGDTELLFGPQSFMQTNYEVAAALYAAAGSVFQEYPAEHLLDLYCGAGAFSLTVGEHAHSVLGIDVSANAIACATEAAIRNNRTNAQFHCRSLEAITSDRLAGSDFDSIICNPPRRGIDAATVALIQTLKPQLLVYSSCNPATLQRDVQRLSKDYQIEQLQAFDMFPFTGHFEVLAMLRRIAR
jgi:23S rRNA (uracil747-C5)-methyltransferase